MQCFSHPPMIYRLGLVAPDVFMECFVGGENAFGETLGEVVPADEILYADCIIRQKVAGIMRRGRITEAAVIGPGRR